MIKSASEGPHLIFFIPGIIRFPDLKTDCEVPALSFLVAPMIARTIGVVRTMVSSHAMASLIYIFLPFAPSFFVAGVMMVFRSFVAYMDNPLRESFTMAMVKSEERGSAAGVTNLARVIPFGISPTISGYMMQSLSMNIPMMIGATRKERAGKINNRKYSFPKAISSAPKRRLNQ